VKSVCLVAQSHYEFDPRVRRKAEALVAAGYEVDVLALRSQTGQREFVLNGVNVRTLSLGKRRGSLGRYFLEYAAFFLWVMVRVAIQMRRRRYGVVEVNTLPDFLVFAPFVGRWMGARLLLDMHEMTPEFYMSKYRIADRSAVIRCLTYLERISMNFADRVITISAPVEDLLVGRGLKRDKSTIIMNSADESRFLTATEVSTPGADTGSTFVMMYHGTLTEIYGLDIAVEAFALVHEEMPGAELWILGSGPEAAALAELTARRGLNSKVRLVGQVPAAEVPSWLRRCDVGVLPIRRDVFLDFAFPNKLPEFIISGKAVIISRLRAIRHYFSDDALAFFEPNDPVDLGAQMVRLFSNHGARAKLATRAQVEYQPIRWDVMKGRYLSLIEELGGRIWQTSAAAGATAEVPVLERGSGVGH
jgi:glycosyltransferase involved in cell wall biosynthesis